MKPYSKTIILVLIMVISSSFTLASKNTVLKNNENTENSLLSAIESKNIGLSVSSIYLLGELNSFRAVIPLMKILHESKCEEARIAASLSLYKIGDERGIFALKMAAKYDDSKRVRKMCEKFYTQFLNDKKIT